MTSVNLAAGAALVLILMATLIAALFGRRDWALPVISALGALGVVMGLGVAVALLASPPVRIVPEVSQTWHCVQWEPLATKDGK